MIDLAMAYELVDDWLPDFIAYEENPHHPLAMDLLARARRRVWDSYEANTTYDNVSNDVTTILQGVAEWIVANRVPS